MRIRQIAIESGVTGCYNQIKIDTFWAYAGGSDTSVSVYPRCIRSVGSQSDRFLGGYGHFFMYSIF